MKFASNFVLLSRLLKKPYFTSLEVRNIGVHPALVNYYIKKGYIRRVRRGVYQSSNYKNPSAFLWDELIEAVHSIREGIVCLISALAIYDLTEEIPRQCWIAISHDTSVKRLKGTRIVRYRNMQLGKAKIEIEGVEIPIFDKERTIIDAFRLLSRETAIKALKAAIAKTGKNRIDVLKLQKYAKKLRFNITPYLISITT